MHALTKQDIEDAKSSIWISLCKGTSIDETAKLLGLNVEICKSLLSQVIEDKALEAKSKPPEHVYIEYVISQTNNIHDLTKMIEGFDGVKNHGAHVSAIKVRAELLDKLIEKGQEFGVFKKVPERREIVAGMLITEMSRADLQTAITNAVSGLNTLMNKYGDNDIIDIVPGEIHHGPKLLPDKEEEDIVAPKSKTKKVKAKMTKTTKSIRGRKKYKEEE